MMKQSKKAFFFSLFEKWTVKYTTTKKKKKKVHLAFSLTVDFSKYCSVLTNHSCSVPEINYTNFIFDLSL